MDDLIYINGVNGATGKYLVQPLSPEQAAGMAGAETTPAPVEKALRTLHQQASTPHLGLPFNVRPEVLSEAGWAIVFHTEESADVRSALRPLIDHRRSTVGNDAIVKELEYRPGETVENWLVRHGVGMGDVIPKKVPFYLLLIGSPEKVSFEFTHLLDVQYSVGRLHFDKPEDYGRYAASVIAYETAASLPNTRDVFFFGPQHVEDKATEISSEILIPGLADSDMFEGWKRRRFTPEQSTKDTLRGVFSGKDHGRPAMLFTAGHGLGWPLGHANQVSATGALLCQDLSDIEAEPIAPQHYFAAADLDASAQVSGVVCFLFACFGAGTPDTDRFLHKPNTPPPQIAEKPMMSQLPKALLSHPNGGALGVFGHVERAWVHSIQTAGAGPQLLPFQNLMGRVLSGQPLGFALKDFNERYASYSTILASLLEKQSFGIPVNTRELASKWIARNDAESYMLFGDPGARVRPDILR